MPKCSNTETDWFAETLAKMCADCCMSCMLVEAIGSCPIQGKGCSGATKTEVIKTWKLAAKNGKRI